jgi:hypothetical protein
MHARIVIDGIQGHLEKKSVCVNLSILVFAPRWYSSSGIAADRENEMNVLRPWKFAGRMEWAEAHPWLAGFYFGLLMSPVYLIIMG